MADEGEGSSLNPTLQEEQVKAVENKARTKGWRPLGEWHGAQEDWVDAKEFVGREKLFDRIADLKTQLHTNSQKFEKEFQAMANHFAGMKEVEYKRALSELKTQLAYAKDERDVESVEKLTTQLAAVEHERVVAKTQTQPQSQPPVNQADPEKFRQFKERNEWFDKDKDLQDEAMSIGIGFSARNPAKTQEQVYEYVESRIKKMYPEKFDMDQEEQEEAPRKAAAVEGTTPSKKLGAKKNGKLSVADLNDQEKEVMKTFVKRGVLTQEAYMDSLAKAKGLI